MRSTSVDFFFHKLKTRLKFRFFTILDQVQKPTKNDRPNCASTSLFRIFLSPIINFYLFNRDDRYEYTLNKNKESTNKRDDHLINKYNLFLTFHCFQGPLFFFFTIGFKSFFFISTGTQRERFTG